MRTFSASPIELIGSFWRRRELIGDLIKRDVVGRYRGSLMGIVWSFINPLFMLAVYTFVFAVIFKARWGGNVSGGNLEFALVLFAGLMVFNVFAECVNKSPGLIISNANYVKKVIFPLEILPWVTMGSALFHGAVSLLVWLLFYTISFGIPGAWSLLLPVVVLPLLLFTLGLSWILASIGTYLRDMLQFIGLITTALMFLSPIFYPITSLPERYRLIFMLNPLTITIEQVRGVLIWNKEPDWAWTLGGILVAALFAWLGFFLFQKTRRGFADVL
ncbi:ABC transporter permease [Dyella koreensis]|uniref:Transport permease protein n=1 Tax=Dyella koreensis TaxID=311235 RepID=A0ABW8K6K7_9GAMM